MIPRVHTITTLKKPIKKGALVSIPRKEYEEFLRFRLKNVREVAMTPVQKKALRVAEQNLKKGKTLSYNELVDKLGFTG